MHCVVFLFVLEVNKSCSFLQSLEICSNLPDHKVYVG